MGWETVPDGGGDFEERERLATKIGSRIEGTIRRVGDVHDGQYGNVRWVAVDTLDGVEGTFPARNALLKAVERAELSPGDQVRIEFTAKEIKQGNTMNLPVIQVNRGGGGETKSAPKKTTAKKATSAPKPPVDDEPDF